MNEPEQAPAPMTREQQIAASRMPTLDEAKALAARMTEPELHDAHVKAWEAHQAAKSAA